MARLYKNLSKKYNKLPDPMRTYFGLESSIFDNVHSWDMLIAFLFMKVERVQHRILYCAVVKKYKVDEKLAEKALNDFHMTRHKFLELYKTLAGKKIGKKIVDFGEKAEKIRGKILHGKNVNETDKKMAISCILEYVKLLNEKVYKDFEFRPFGDMTGFKGNVKSHDKETSKWMLMGMGLL